MEKKNPIAHKNPLANNPFAHNICAMEPISPIKNIRKNLFKVTQADFASIAGVVQSSVARWEKGEGSPSLIEMQAIRQAAADHKIEWDDRLFFEVPKLAAEVDAP